MKVTRLNNESEDGLICAECGYTEPNMLKISFRKNGKRYITYRDGNNTSYIGSFLLCKECFHTLMYKMEKEWNK